MFSVGLCSKMKNLLMQMYPGWSARDNYAIHKKRRKRKVKQVDSKGDDVMEEEAGKKESECILGEAKKYLYLYVLA